MVIVSLDCRAAGMGIGPPFCGVASVRRAGGWRQQILQVLVAGSVCHKHNPYAVQYSSRAIFRTCSLILDFFGLVEG